MYCRKCGTEIPDDSAFCPKCGAAVAQEKVLEKLEPQPEPQTTSGVVCTDNDESGLSEIRELNKRIKSGELGQKQRKRRKIVSGIVKIAAVLAVVAATLIIFIPQAGIGYVYKRVDGNHYVITRYTGSSSEVTIPDTIWFIPVTSIDMNAFRMETGKPGITKVKLGKNISEIGISAFENYSSLEELDCSAVKMKDGKRFLVNAHAFENCTNLKKIIFPHSGIYIEDLAFSNCSSLEDIITAEQHILFTSENQNFKATIGLFEKNSYIGNRAFRNCTSLKNLSLINTRVDSVAFLNCTGVSELIMTGGELGDITPPEMIPQDNTGKSLREAGLKEIQLRAQGLNPSSSAFKGCTSLKTVELNFLEENPIPNSTFFGCTSLTSVFGANISAIGDKAFGNCTSLSEVEFETNPSDISETAFIGCTKLEQESQLDEVPEVDGQKNTKKNNLTKYEDGVFSLFLSFKNFTSKYGMPDEYYNGLAIYNVGNTQYCIRYDSDNYSTVDFDPNSTEGITQIEIYGGKEVNLFNGMHLGEDVYYYQEMADRLSFFYNGKDLSSQVYLGAGNHGATWYEFKLMYAPRYYFTFLLNPDTMTTYGVKIMHEVMY